MTPLSLSKSSWLLLWFLRKSRCHLGGTRQLSVTPVVWACGWLHIFTQCKQQTADMRVWMYLRVCIYCSVDTNWQRPAIVQPAAYLHLTRAWSLVWNVIYLRHASPSALKTKIFIEWPTTLYYLLTASTAHCWGWVINVAVDIFPVISLVFLLFLISTPWSHPNFPLLLCVHVCSSALWLVVYIKDWAFHMFPSCPCWLQLERVVNNVKNSSSWSCSSVELHSRFMWLDLDALVQQAHLFSCVSLSLHQLRIDVN